MINKEYFITIAGIGIRATYFERSGNFVNVYRDNKFLFCFIPKYNQLKFNFKDKDCTFFNLIEK